MIECPQCHTYVLPTSSGQCPNCRRILLGEGAVDQPESSALTPIDFSVRASRTRPALQLIVFLLFFVAFVPRVRSEAAATSLLIAVFLLGPAFLALLRTMVHPPRILLVRGSFSLRAPKKKLQCSASNVEDVAFEGPRLRITFKSIDAVEPEAARASLADCFAKKGCHVDLDGWLFRREGIAMLRRALGLEGSQSTQPRTPLGAFYNGLYRRMPRATGTLAIIALNVVVFLGMTAAGVHPLNPDVFDLVRWGADYAPRMVGMEWWRMLSSMFLHFGALHLLFNMWVLRDVGSLVERLLGREGFLLTYLLSGLAGSLLGVYWHPTVVAAGASGAVFGLFGALLGYSCFQRQAIPRIALQDFRRSGLAFIVFNGVLGSSMEGLDWAGHVGGLACGSLCGVLLAMLPGPAYSRPRWNMAVLGSVGAIFVGLGIYFAPVPPDDFLEELQRFTRLEKDVLDRYNELQSELRQGSMSEDLFAEALEKDVIPRWREEQERLVHLKGAPDWIQRSFSKLAAYMALRQESWQLLVAGVRGHDEDLLKQAGEMAARANSEAAEASGGK